MFLKNTLLDIYYYAEFFFHHRCFPFHSLIKTTDINHFWMANSMWRTSLHIRDVFVMDYTGLGSMTHTDGCSLKVMVGVGQRLHLTMACGGSSRGYWELALRSSSGDGVGSTQAAHFCFSLLPDSLCTHSSIYALPLLGQPNLELWSFKVKGKEKWFLPDYFS